MKTRIRNIVFAGAWAGTLLLAGGLALGYDIGYRSFTVDVGPYIEASATYDSNVKLATEDEQSDVFFQTQAGVDLGLIYKWLKVDAIGYSYSRTYSDTNPEDSERLSSGQRVALGFGRRDRLAVGVSESFERTADYSLLTQPKFSSATMARETAITPEDWSDRTDRRLWRLGLTLGRDVTDKIEADGTYHYTKNDYARDELNDSERDALQLMLGYKVTDKSSLFLDGRYSIESSEGYEDDGTVFYIGPGYQTHMTEKVDLMGSVGYETYRSGILRGSDERSEVDSIGVHMSGTWRPRDRLVFGLNGQRGVESSVIDNNTREVTLAGLTTGYRLTDDLTTSLLLSCRWDDYDIPTDGGDEARKTRSEGGSLLLSYTLSRYVTVHGSLTYEITDSNKDDYEYDQLRAMIGARAKF